MAFVHLLNNILHKQFQVSFIMHWRISGSSGGRHNRLGRETEGYNII